MTASPSASTQPLTYASSSIPAQLRAWAPNRAQTITNVPTNASHPNPSTASVIMTHSTAGWVPAQMIERVMNLTKLLTGPPVTEEG